jgi:hypothetical protein
MGDQWILASCAIRSGTLVPGGKRPDKPQLGNAGDQRTADLIEHTA